MCDVHSLVITIREYYKFSQFSLITVLFSFKIMKFFTIYNNAIKTVQQSTKDKKDIYRRADAQQRYLTQDFTL